jgi:hypothetical protein
MLGDTAVAVHPIRAGRLTRDRGAGAKVGPAGAERTASPRPTSTAAQRERDVLPHLVRIAAMAKAGRKVGCRCSTARSADRSTSGPTRRSARVA